MNNLIFLFNSNITYTIYRYIEVINNLIFTILKFKNFVLNKQFNIENNINNKKSIVNKNYIQVHKWSNINIPEKYKFITHRPLKWRPTFVNYKLFKNEMKNLLNKILSKTKTLCLNKYNNNIWTTISINNKYKKFKIEISNKFNKYINKIKYNRIRNVNINKNQLKYLKTFNQELPNVAILNTDKNRGNLIEYKDNWINFSNKYIKKHPNNIKEVKINIKTIIENAKKELIQIINKYKSIIYDYKKAYKYIHSGLYDKIGIFNPLPKVHKKDTFGNPIRKIRPIISMKNTIITISSKIVCEITRMINYRLKINYNNNIECDDIRDIINNIKNFNKSEQLRINDQLIVCDIEGMYDNISPEHVYNSFNIAIDQLLPYNDISDKHIDLWQKAMNHLYKYSYFKDNKKKTYLMKNSQIQGSNNGGDTCSLYLIVNEIMNNNFNKLLKFIVRYRDDIFLITNNINIKNHHHFTKFISKLYKDFKFESNISYNTAEICDVTIIFDRKNMKLKTTTLVNKDKVISYINKTSNVKQSPNSFFKTLQQRYIIIEDNLKDYNNTKKRICNILINKNEWSSYDIRKCSHLTYKNRWKYIQTYLSKKLHKYKSYINSKQLYLYQKIWKIDLNHKHVINGYITYQKTLINNNNLQNIIKQSINKLNKDTDLDIDIKLFYKYQPSINDYIR